MLVSMPVNIMAKNYSHCPLKKRPVHIVEDFSDEPQNLSTKPEDLIRTGRVTSSSTSPPDMKIKFEFNLKISNSDINSSVSPPSSPATSPPVSPPMSSPSPPHHLYQPIKTEPCLPYHSPIKTEPCPPYHPHISPDYAPQTWHRSVAPLYPPTYNPFMPYNYNHEYMGILSPTSPYSDSSCSPPHPHVHNQPLVPLALRPTMYSSIDQSSLSPSSSTTSPPPTTPEDLSEKRRQGIRHQCPDCGKSYSTFSGLSKHRQFHCAAGDGPRKSFSCKYCEKVYVSLGALKMHIRTHTLPCKCTMCGKAFSRPWLLQGHIRTHTGEKPFSCSYCNRAFADRSNLRAHLQTHSDVKKYSCPTCSKTFSRMSLLTKHAEGGCNGTPGLLHAEKIY